jgi:hypothetical protein
MPCRPAVLPQIDKALEKEGLVLRVGSRCDCQPRKLPAAQWPCTSLCWAGQVQQEGEGALVFLRLVVVERLAGVDPQDGKISCEELYMLQVRPEPSRSLSIPVLLYD